MMTMYDDDDAYGDEDDGDAEDHATADAGAEDGWRVVVYGRRMMDYARCMLYSEKRYMKYD